MQFVENGSYSCVEKNPREGRSHFNHFITFISRFCREYMLISQAAHPLTNKGYTYKPLYIYYTSHFLYLKQNHDQYRLKNISFSVFFFQLHLIVFMNIDYYL